MRSVAAAQKQHRRLASEVSRAGRWLCDLYALDLEIDAGSFVISPEFARELQPEGARPRSGVLAIEEAGGLQLGLYLDPLDRGDPGTLIEETSHLVCLAWHGARDLPISALTLELQGEVDRFLYGCHARLGAWPEGLAAFEAGRWADWLDDDLRHRYEVARDRAHRYCRDLVRRFARRRDVVGLAGELRRFYRCSPSAKLRV